MYVRTLRIQNLRCFEREKLELSHPGRERPDRADTIRHLPNVTLLLGDNGAGKTTVLRAIALGALAPVMATSSGYVPFSLVRRTKLRTAAQAKIEAGLQLEEHEGYHEEEVPQTLTLRPLSDFNDIIEEFDFPYPRNLRKRLYDERDPGYFLLGYSANRRVEPSRNVDESSRYKARSPKYLRVAGLFEENVTLMPLSVWLPQLRRREPTHFREVIELINGMLPEGARLLAKLQGDEYLFRIGGSDLPFPALSDGYRAHVGWISDMLYHLSRSCPPRRKLVDMRGVVLVDEIDLHFHPQWQRQVVPKIAQALPNLQFVFTTHSPIVTGTLSSANVRLVRERLGKNGISRSVIESPDEEMYGFSADQILTSNTFGLDSTRDSDFFGRLQSAAREARTGGPEAAIRYMRMVSAGAAAEEPTPPPSRRKVSPLRNKRTAARAASLSRKGTRKRS
ncbi:AAA family ATPase [Archangium sp.]|jgi:hypothetical protein|uniref:AAA family ATPase n=1 Tax=Archangium sp. TaxID=1872627 RepID=UPI002ED958E5